MPRNCMQYALYVKRWNHFLVDSTDVGIHVISELPGDVLFITFDNRWPKCARFLLAMIMLLQYNFAQIIVDIDFCKQ